MTRATRLIFQGPCHSEPQRGIWTAATVGQKSGRAGEHDPARLSTRFGYSWALAGFEGVTILVLSVVLMLGHEQKGRAFHAGDLLVESE